MLRAHNAAESVRQRQQGYGRPIVSWVDHGNRFVAVGDTLFWQKNWLVFTDFLFYFLPKTLGFEWGSRAQKEKSPHPIFRWLAKRNVYTRRPQRLLGPPQNSALDRKTRAKSTKSRGSAKIVGQLRLAT